MATAMAITTSDQIQLPKIMDSGADFAQRLRAVGQVLADAKRVGLISHARPDGDAIGSVIALGSALRSVGCQVTILNQDGVPDSLAFLPGSDGVSRPVDFPDGIEVDVLVILDTGSYDRAGERALATFCGQHQVINIDHHDSNPGYGDINLIDIKAPATGQIVFQLITEMGWPLDAVARDNLFVAISSDTGSFRYPSTTAATYRIGAELIEAGTDVGKLSQLLYESYPLRRIELLRELMKDMQIRDNGRIALFKMPRSLVDKLALIATDTEGLIDLIRSIDTVVVAAFFEEMEDGRIRISARSKTPAVDVGALCSNFGGGGHTLAAGTRMKGPLDRAVEIFTKAISDQLNECD